MSFTPNLQMIVRNATAAKRVYTLKNPRNLSFYQTYYIDKGNNLVLIEGPNDYREVTLEDARKEYAENRKGMNEYIGTRNSYTLRG